MENLLEQLQAKAAGHPPSIPLKMLVVADCGAGDAGARITVGLAGLFESLRPAVKLSTENRLQKGGQKLEFELQFGSLGDFRPESVVARLPVLSEALAAGNPALAEQLDLVLHHPEFQRVEAAWRGLARLCRELEDKPGVLVDVLNVARKNLKEVFHSRVFEPEYKGEAGPPLSAVYFDFRFSHEPADLPVLEALAADCAALEAPMIAAVSPAFFQLKNIAHLPSLPELGPRLQQPAYASWRRFQTDPVSRWACLTVNRFLARESYALSREAETGLEYRERADAAHPENYVWAEAGWLILCNLARSYSKFRHCVVIDGMSPDTAHANLPVRPFPKKANVEVPSPTEILLDDNKAWEIVRAGITVLVGMSDGAVASFPLLANVYRLKPGVVTVESALSYQLFAGNLFHFLLDALSRVPHGSRKRSRSIRTHTTRGVPRPVRRRTGRGSGKGRARRGRG